MKNIKKILLPIAALILVSCLMGCPPGSIPGGSDVYVPDINGSWANADASVSDLYVFTSAPANSAEGRFTGSEQLNGVTVATFSGSFMHSQIHFLLTYKTAGLSPVDYSGKVFGTKPEMILYGGGKTLRLIKQGYQLKSFK